MIGQCAQRPAVLIAQCAQCSAMQVEQRPSVLIEQSAQRAPSMLIE